MVVAGAGLVALLGIAGVALGFGGEPPQRAAEGLASAVGAVAVGAVAEEQVEVAEAAAAEASAVARDAASATPKFAPAAPRAKPKKRRYERFDE